MHALVSVITLMLVAGAAAAGCMQRSTSSTNPVGPVMAGAGDTPTQTTLAGTWRSVVIHPASQSPITRSLSYGPAAAGLDPRSCGSFQWVAANQTPTSISGKFSAVCAGSLVSGTGSGQLTSPTSVALTVEGSGTLPGLGCVRSYFGQRSFREQHAASAWDSGTSCGGPISGSETLRRDDLYPDPPSPEPPPPPPPPPPTVEPPPPPSSGGGNSGPAMRLTCARSPSCVAPTSPAGA